MDTPSAADVKERVREILARMADLEKELEEELEKRQDDVLYQISNRKVRFEEEVRQAHKRLRFAMGKWLRESQPRNVLSAPFIYAMIVPIALLDLVLSVYQAICFPLYRIAKVDRTDFIAIDRHRLAYLNAIEKLNCAYCGYANGVLGYAREIASKTEQYWCPIKHARHTLGMHGRYARFLDYGDPEAHSELRVALREDLAREYHAANADRERSAE